MRTSTIYQLRIELRGTKPPIWRRVLVPSSMTLDRLHEVIQTAMGWYDSHLHMFVREEQIYKIPWDDEFAPFGMPAPRDERKHRLGRILKRERDWLRYEYDFGDGWEHRVTLQKILPPDPAVKLPVCTGGKRRCPPEDSGGVWGYYDKLEILKNEDHPEHEEVAEWMGRNLDPEDFRVEEVNVAFRFLEG